MNKRAAARCAVFAAAVLAAVVLGGCGGPVVRHEFAFPIERALPEAGGPVPRRSGLDAIGRLHRNGGLGLFSLFFTQGPCTAFLVDRDKIMTAAHCLESGGGGFYQPETLVFQARRDRRVKSRVAKYLHIGDYSLHERFRGKHVGQAVSHVVKDAALLQLEKPLGDIVGWLPRGEVDWDEMADGGEYQIAGFPMGRWDIMKGCSLHPNMAAVWERYYSSVHSAFEKGVFFHTCYPIPGSSGAPLLRKDSAGLSWIGVNSDRHHDYWDWGRSAARQVGFAMILQPKPPGPPPGAAADDAPAPADVRDEFKATGETWTVKAAGGGDFTTVTEAVEAASGGDAIRVYPGVYRESIFIKKEIYIEGAGGDREDIIIEPDDDPCISFIVSRAAVRGMTLRNPDVQERNTPCVVVFRGRILVADNDISSGGHSGVYVSTELPNGEVSAFDVAPVVIGNRIHAAKMSGIDIRGRAKGRYENNEIFGNQYAGVFAGRRAAPLAVGNRIFDNEEYGVVAEEGATGRFENNKIFNNRFSGVLVQTGADPVFTGNSIYDGERFGAAVVLNGKGRFENNKIFNNGLSGVLVKTGADPVFVRNSIYFNKASGLLISQAGKGRFEGNQIFNSRQWGAMVKAGGDPVFEHNRFADNGKAVFSVSAGARMTALGNDLSANKRGAWDIKDGADVIRTGNVENSKDTEGGE